MKEKDYIEDIILKHIEELNDNEPMEGHFARFEAKLNARNKKKRKITYNVFLFNKFFNTFCNTISPYRRKKSSPEWFYIKFVFFF